MFPSVTSDFIESDVAVYAGKGELNAGVVVNLQAELSYLQAHLATMELPTPPPAPPHAQPLLIPSALTISDLPAAASAVPATYDLSSLFDPVVHPSWTLQQRQQIDPRQFSTTRAPPEMPSSPDGVGGDDLQELARELLNRHAPPTVPCRNQASSFPPNSR
ncbi:hypothetical protein BUALT_Bualt01G0212900 [Buddleja alternifolia]|uniref:Uncharacterized protein n=1 Tax=Buddleja alternifolia TaxID=168488 RepID=A0AAV6YFV8_9LAMI|nr:hypothetical protein BUALT_Bualt01G0212900 [Buddleja alternifolia]